MTESDFLALIDRTETCWLWRGAMEGDDRCPGKIQVGRLRGRAHRVMLALDNPNIPSSAYVRRTCGVLRCVRTSHMKVHLGRDIGAGRVSVSEVERDAPERKPTFEFVSRIPEKWAHLCAD